MDVAVASKPHAVCVPLPAQGHINPMLSLAKLLHLLGFHVTFLLTHFNFDLLLNFRGPNSLDGLPGFRFEAISDGLPPANKRGILDLPALCLSMPLYGLRSFRELIARMGASPDVPPVTCIVSDGVMGFTLKVAQEFNIPEFVLFTPSGCGMLGYLNFEELEKRGFFPLKGNFFCMYRFLYIKYSILDGYLRINLFIGTLFDYY